VAGLVPSDIIASLWDAIRSNNFDRLSTAVDDLLLEGYAAPLVLNQLHDDLVVMEGLSDATKVNLLIHSLFTAI